MPSTNEMKQPAEPARRPVRWRLGWALVTAALAVAALVAVLWSTGGAKVESITVEKREIVQRVVATGRVEPPARVTIGSMVAGVAIAVGPEEGERVEGGQLLVALEPAEAQAAVEQAQAGVASAKARLVQLKGTGALVATEALRQAEISLANAESNLARTETLRRSAAVADKELEEARKQVELARSQREAARVQAASASSGGADTMLAQAALTQAEAVLSQARARLAQTKILSPAAGVVLNRAIEPGDIVTAGRALMVLARDGRTRLVAQPDEKALAFLAPGQKALASADAFPESRFSATVLSVAPAVDPTRGTVEVKLDVPEPPAYLRADMTVSIDVEVGRAGDALVVPAGAIQELGGASPWVWLIQGKRVEKRPVRIGLRGEGSAQVLSGLQEGDRIVSSAARSLRPGQAVRATPRGAN